MNQVGKPVYGNNLIGREKEINNKKVNIARAINTMKDQGIISTQDATYVLNDPLFNEWIIRNVLRK